MEYLNSLVTLLVGSVALIVYFLAKRNEKRNAATIIVMDIRHAENVVISTLEKGFVDKDTKDALAENNWSKYKHLFASSFSQDDFVAFNRFFESCVEMSDARQRMRETLYASLNAKAEIMQQKIFEIDNLDTIEGQEKRQKLISLMNNESYIFDPNEPKDRLIKNLQIMGKLSNTVAFEKLKKIAAIRT